jgi:hypothetical protein
MLMQRFISKLGPALTTAVSYHPFPTVGERRAWDALPAEVRRGLIEHGEKLLGYAWPALSATLYMDFARTGNRSRYEGPYFARRGALGRLVLAECAEGQGRFLDDIIAGIWAICEETSWVIPAHNPRRPAAAKRAGAEGAGEEFAGDHPLPDPYHHDVDLFAGETGSLLAWTQYLLQSRLEAVTPRICEYLRQEVTARILDPFLARDDFWWMGGGDRWRLNNWSPWCGSTCLAAFLLIEQSPERRMTAVAKVMGILDRWLAGYHEDGGRDEGPSYWTVAGGALFDCLELLYSATNGQVNVYGESLIQEIGRYIYRAHISGDYFVNFADCGGKVHIPAGLVYRYGRRINDQHMVALGRDAHQRQGGPVAGSLLRSLPDLFGAEGLAEPAQAPFVRDVWLPGIQVMAAREHQGSDRGFYLAAKGGHNNENHNHNDVGQFLVYHDGQPVLIDVGVGTYTAKTFSDQRYEIWTMQSAYHNLPTVNGVQQEEGEQFRAAQEGSGAALPCRDVSYRSDDSAAELSLDIASAYPAEAGIRSWRRTCRLLRGNNAAVEIVDDFSLAAPTKDIAFSLMTPCEVKIEEAGRIALQAGGRLLALSYDADMLQATVEEIVLEDERLKSGWGENMSRLLLTAKRPVGKGQVMMRIERGA